MQDKNWKIRIAPSLGDGFAGTPHEVWGVGDYRYSSGFLFGDPIYNVHQEYPTVFFGLYGLPDFFALWRHKGRRAILWAGSDITNFVNGYWLDDKGTIKISPRPLATWINKFCESYVENEIEKEALKNVGIESAVVPSFLGKVEDFPICFTPSGRIRLYTSVSGDNFELYGWDKIPKLANANPDIEFHLYGNSEVPYWRAHNIFVHGRVSQQQMDEETKKMNGALRLTEFDGFSEIIAKSLLWGQWPVSIIEYPYTFKPENIDMLKIHLGIKKEPNLKGREWLLSVVNKYPWNQNK